MQVERKDIVSVYISHVKVKILDTVQFLHDLGKTNYWVFDQLMPDGNSLWFDDDAYVITNKKSSK